MRITASQKMSVRIKLNDIRLFPIYFFPVYSNFAEMIFCEKDFSADIIYLNAFRIEGTIFNSPRYVSIPVFGPVQSRSK